MRVSLSSKLLNSLALQSFTTVKSATTLPGVKTGFEQIAGTQKLPVVCGMVSIGSRWFGRNLPVTEGFLREFVVGGDDKWVTMAGTFLSAQRFVI